MNSNSESNSDSAQTDFQDQLDILRQIPFFSQLPLETNKVLAYLCNREIFKQNAQLFSQGDTDGQALYILSGSARIEHKDGSDTLHIRDVGPGTFIGGLSLMAEISWLFSLTATEDLVCLVITREKFRRILEQFPDIMSLIIKGLAVNIRNWEERMLSDHSQVCPQCIGKAGVSLL
jgi:CRP/FNR family cyclic AMP-dependent transcriptional regulator